MSNSEIISGDYWGDLMMWDIDQGICTRHLAPYALWHLRYEAIYGRGGC